MKYIFEYTGRKIMSYDSETKQYKVTTAKKNGSIYSLHKTVRYKDCIVANTPYTMYNKLFNNGDKISISKKTIKLNYYRKTGYWNIDTKKTRMTFNLKTGMTYIIEGKKIKNISYSTSNIEYVMRSCNMYPGVKIDEDKIFKEAYELIANYKEKMYNKKPVEYEYINNLALFNRFPYITSESLFKESDYTVKYMNKVSQDSYIDQAILSTINNTKISKGLRKAILNSSKYEGVLICKVLLIINKLLKYLKTDNVRKLFDSLTIFALDRLSENIKFIKNIPEHLENSFINKIVKDSGRLIYDTLHMYNIVLRSNKDYKIDYRKSIEEIHDDLSEVSYAISNPLVVFKNTKEERALEYSDGDYCIKIAKTNYELYNIGKTMHICVGSYSNYVKKRLLSIYTLQNSNGKPIVCIEVRDDKVMQCKMKFNKPVYENQELLKYINKWMDKNKLESCSYDLHTSDDIYPLPPTIRNNQAV